MEKNKQARVKRRGGNKDAMSEDGDEEDVGMGSGSDEEIEEPVNSVPRRLPPTLKRRAFEDTTNAPLSAKRVRSAREPPKSVNAILETYGPQYKPRNRTRNVTD